MCKHYFREWYTYFRNETMVIARSALSVRGGRKSGVRSFVRSLRKIIDFSEAEFAVASLHNTSALLRFDFPGSKN